MAGSNCQTCLLHFIVSESLPDHVDKHNVYQKCLGTKSSNFKKAKLLLLKWNNDDSRNGIQGGRFSLLIFFLSDRLQHFFAKAEDDVLRMSLIPGKAVDFESLLLGSLL